MLHIVQAVISAKIVSQQLRQWKPPCVIAKDCEPKTVSCIIPQWCISPRTHLWFTENKQNHWFMVADYTRHYCAGAQKGKIISHGNMVRGHIKPRESGSPQELFTIITLDKPKGRITTCWGDETHGSPRYICTLSAGIL